MKFYLGTHMPHWLNDATVPLFVSHRRLMARPRPGPQRPEDYESELVAVAEDVLRPQRPRKLPRAAMGWALDSGGFTELSMFGRWVTTEHEYATAVRRYRDEIGNLEWAAPMDWMCEPFMLAKTGRSIAEHQQLTVDNYRRLSELAPDLPFVPVLQGQTISDYLRHADQYAAAGVNLTDERVVGVGSVCRRQATSEIEALLVRLAADGLNLHGFGVKTVGLARYSHALTSSDSMAWSFRGRHVPGCTPTHKSEANCLSFALDWRARALDRSQADQQTAIAL